MILAAALVAAWAAYSSAEVQMGVTVDNRLILLVPREGCGAGLKIYSGKYGDLELATDFLSEHKVCDLVDERRRAREHR